MLNVDLHCHSNISDGMLAPAAVAARAKANGVDVWALTDHDEVSGIARGTRRRPPMLGMRYVPGVEISVTWAGQTVHIVGLQIDETNEDLVQGLGSHPLRPRTARPRNGRRSWPRPAFPMPSKAR